MVERITDRLRETGTAQRYDANEAFAEALRGDRQDTVIYENSEFLAFVDSCPHAGEHVAIISKSPITRLAADQDEELAHRLSLVMHKLVEAVCSVWPASPVVVTAHNDLTPYPTIDRLHVLILPRWAERSERAAPRHVSKRHLSRLAQKLATAIA